MPHSADDMTDFLPLPNGRWAVWRQAVLRSAGFPASGVDTMADPELAAAADAADPADATDTGPSAPEFDAAFAAAGARTLAAAYRWAHDDRFREAVTWQTPSVVTGCLDRMAPEGVRNKRARQREMVVARYLQRYTTKNDTVGFFGPVGWAEWEPTASGVLVRPGPAVVRHRRVFFEQWAIDEVARTFAARPGIAPWVAPRQLPAYLYLDDRVVRQAGQTTALSPDESLVLRWCDGARTVDEIRRGLAADGHGPLSDRVPDILRELVDRGLVAMDLVGPIEADPEHRLARRLSRVPDRDAREQAMAELDELVRARDEVAAAAGDHRRLGERIGELHARFEKLVGVSATRRPGRIYAGRTPVYLDSVRDVTVRLGGDVLAALGEPLGLVLDSARWLATRIGEAYLERLQGLYARRRQRTGEEWVPLGSLLAMATRDFYTGRGAPPLAAAATEELVRRWAEVLQVPPGVRHHRLRARDVANTVATRFATAPPPWAGARVHSPDVMIAAPSTEALADGDYQLVLGELHAAFNTVESRAIVEQSADPQRLLAMTQVASGPDRIVVVAPREWPEVNSRTCPPTALLSPTFRYVAVSDDDTANIPGEVLPLAALTVGPGDGGLVVRCRRPDRVLPLAEVIGDYLSGVTVNSFRIMPPESHTPRVSIDRLVVAREAWRLPAEECRWAFEPDEARRYRRMRRWARQLGLPRRVFCSAPTEPKPIYIDLTSIPLTNLLAGVIRGVAAAGVTAPMTLTEMFPDPERLWLVDHTGARYTSELRLVISDVASRGSPRGAAA